MKLTDNILEKVEDHKHRIGELLVQYTSLSKEQLQEALALQEESGMLIGEILLKKKLYPSPRHYQSHLHSK